MKNPIAVPELRELLSASDATELNAFVEAVHPATVADLLGALEAEEVRAALGRMNPERRGSVFAHFDLDIQAALAESMHRNELAEILTWMSPDERVDLISELPEELQESVLPALAHAEREEVRRLGAYEDGTAGSVMTSDYATLAPHLTARDAIEALRRVAPDKETIYYAYVVDAERRLIGMISLRDLIVAAPHRRIEDLMKREFISARVGDDLEEVARKIAKYDLLALPVVVDRDVMVGIVTSASRGC